MPKPLHPPKWYVLHEHDGGSTLSEVADQPDFTGKPDARKWLLGTKDEPGNAPSSGKFLLLRQLDEQDLVVETVRTVRQASEVSPENEQPADGEDEAQKTWSEDDNGLGF